MSDRGVKCGLNAVNGRTVSDVFCDLSSGKNAIRSAFKTLIQRITSLVPFRQAVTEDGALRPVVKRKRH